MKIGVAGPFAIDSLKDYLHIEDEAHLKLGARATSVNGIMRGLLNQGAQVYAYTLDGRVKEPITIKGDNLTIRIAHARGRAWRRVSDFFAYEANEVQKLIAMDDVDIVHAHWSYEYAVGAIKSGLPHLITFRDASWEILKIHRDMYRVVRWMIDLWVKRNGQHFNVNSPYLQKKLASMKKELPIVPNPVDDQFIANTMQSKSHPKGKVKVIALLTGWIKRKNPIPALHAFQMLRQAYGDKVEFHLFGPGYSEHEPGYLWAQENNLLDGVFFRGTMAHSQIMAGLGDYDILLHPAIEESFGMPLIEGLCCGLPVIAGQDAGAVPWVLNYGENGILVDVESPQAMFEAMQNLIEDAGLYERLSNTGLDYVRDHFTTEKVAEKYIELYDKILAKDASRVKMKKNFLL